MECLYGGEPALLVGLALVGGLNFTSLLQWKFSGPSSRAGSGTDVLQEG